MCLPEIVRIRALRTRLRKATPRQAPALISPQGVEFTSDSEWNDGIMEYWVSKVDKIATIWLYGPIYATLGHPIRIDPIRYRFFIRRTRS